MSVRIVDAKRLVQSALLFVLSSALGSLAYAAGDVAAGKAQSMVCASCHGQDGATAIDPSYPQLAGQNERYLARQLNMFQSGERDVALMTAQLIGKSEQDLDDLAAYYASLPAKTGEAVGSDADVELAERIYKGGIAKKGVAACSSCHGPGGAGNAQAGFPRISGQSAAYTAAQLIAYREGERRSDEEYGGMMRGVSRGLSDREIVVLSDYISGLN
jgi:cytochrome c553